MGHAHAPGLGRIGRMVRLGVLVLALGVVASACLPAPAAPPPASKPPATTKPMPTTQPANLGFPAGQLTNYSTFVGLGDADGEPLRFSNTGAGPTGVLSASIVGQSGTSELSVSGGNPACQGSTLAAGAECRVQVRFESAGTPGVFTGTLRVTDGAANTIDVPLSGTVHEDFSVTGDTGQWDPSATPGDDDDGVLAITNDADDASGALSISLVSPSGEGVWSLQATANDCSTQQLAAGATCNVEVRLSSTGVAGAASVTLRLDDGNGNGLDIPLTGTIGP